MRYAKQVRAVEPACTSQRYASADGERATSRPPSRFIVSWSEKLGKKRRGRVIFAADEPSFFSIFTLFLALRLLLHLLFNFLFLLKRIRLPIFISTALDQAQIYDCLCGDGAWLYKRASEVGVCKPLSLVLQIHPFPGLSVCALGSSSHSILLCIPSKKCLFAYLHSTFCTGQKEL